MPLSEQLVVRVSGPVTREVLDRLRHALRLQRSGRLGDPEDVHFGHRYLRRTDTELADLTLVREDDTHWRLEVNHSDRPLPAETVAAVRADILAAAAGAGLQVDEVREVPDPGTAGG